MGELRCATRPVFDAITVRLPLLFAKAVCAACARYMSAFTLIAKSRSNSCGVVRRAIGYIAGQRDHLLRAAEARCRLLERCSVAIHRDDRPTCARESLD